MLSPEAITGASYGDEWMGFEAVRVEEMIIV